MKCNRARHEIALAAGNDLDEAATKRLDRHLQTCPECRQFQAEMAVSVPVLQEVRQPTPALPLHDLWPAVSIAVRRPTVPASRRSLGLAPAFAVIATCLIMLVYSNEAWTQPRATSNSLVSVARISFSPSQVKANQTETNRKRADRQDATNSPLRNIR